MNTQLIYLGYGGYKIITPEGKHVVIDPFLTGNPVAPYTPESLGQVDLLLITHSAYDHFGDAPEILKRNRCPVVCAKDVSHRLTEVFKIDPDLIRVTIWGMAMNVLGIPVRPVASVHWSFAIAPDGGLFSGPAMGFIIETEPDVRIYHPGDTAITRDMQLWGELYKPTVGLMHVMLPENSLPHMEVYLCGELTEAEAVLASQWLGLKHVVASHYVNADAEGVKTFVRLAEKAKAEGTLDAKISVMKPGEILVL
jgi:L-ascorbate metabolism protein UlaG (beta-lactamase superfamily)